MPRTFQHQGREYSVEVNGEVATLRAFGLLTTWRWADYMDRHEDADWAEITHEVLMDDGLLAWSEILNDYVTTENQDDCEAAALREAAAEAEHVRQESRSDIFL